MKAKFVLMFFVLLAVNSSSFTRASDEVLEVTGRAVVFIEPTDKEYNSLPEDEKIEWNEVISDFFYYRDRTTSFLKENKIKVIKTSNSKIIIHIGSNTRTYMRKKFKNLVGYILSDGKNEPISIESVGTDVDMIMDFKEYFNIN